jgi:hypothetical protein
MNDEGQPGHGWAVLRRRPVRIAAGRPEGGYTGEFEIICCDCGDDPDLDYREVTPELQQSRGPYPIVAGIAAYETHASRHPTPQRTRQPRRRVRDAGGCSPVVSSQAAAPGGRGRAR